MRLPGVAAVAAGVMAMGIAVAQGPPGEPGKAGGSGVESPRSSDPLGSMLGDARSAHVKIRDYSGVFTRQERIQGTLSSEQVGEIKVRTSPVGVYVRFGIPAGTAGMEVAYTASRRDGKVRYRQPGAAGRNGMLKLDPDDPRFLAENRHPVTDWGIGPLIELIARSTAREKLLNNPVEVHTADFQFARKNVTQYEIYMRRPHALRYAAKMVVFIDKETKLPVRFEAYDDPKAGAMTGELLEAYSFTDLKYNTGIGENTFDR